MKKLTVAVVMCSALALAAPPAKKGAPPSAPKDVPTAELSPEDTRKALYALGVMVAQRTPLAGAGLSEEDLAVVLSGVSDVVTGKELAVKLPEVMPKVDQFLREKQQERAQAEKAKGATYLAAQEKLPGAQKQPSGLIFFETQAGSGSNPTAEDTVKVHYKGTLIDGTEFDSSYKRGEPAEFPLNRVVKCWTEGVQKIKVGGKARLVCPPEIAYGERGAPPSIPGNSVLNFEVELIEIKGK